MYGNEAQVGEAVRESGVPRSQVYISGSPSPHLPGVLRHAWNWNSN